MKEKKGLFKITFIILSIISSALLIAAFVIYRISFVDLIKYLVFQAFYIVVPGCLAYRWLKLKGDTLERLTAAYGLGVVLTIIQYYVFYLINAKVLIFITGPVLSIVELTLSVRVRKKESYSRESFQVPYGLLTLFLVVFMVMFVSFTMYNPLPSVVGRTTFNQDLLWAVGNISAHIRNIVPFDSRLSGVGFQYHYFMTLHLGVMAYVTKIDAAALFFQFSHMGKLAFLFFSMYCLGKNVFYSSKKASFFVFIYFFTMCASSKFNKLSPNGLFLNVNFQHIISSPYGFALSLAFMCMTVVFILKQYKEDKLNKSYLIAAAFFLATATGSKGPLGAVVAAVVTVILFILMLRKNPVRIHVIYWGVLILAFSIIYMLLLSGGDSTLGFSFGYTVTGTALRRFIAAGVPLIVLTFAHFILYLPFAAPLFIIWMGQRIRHFKDTDESQLLIGGLATCGVVTTYIMKQDGHSELFFIMAAIPFIELCALDLLYKYYKQLHFTLKAVIACSLLLSLSTTAFTIYYFSRISYYTAKNVLSKAVYEGEPAENAITRYEYEGLNWIKNNTPEDAVIGGDRYYYSQSKNEGEARYFYYTAFSERQLYLEGWYYHFKQGSSIVDKKLQLMNELYNGSETALNELKKENVSYVIVSRIEHPGLSLEFRGLKSRFKNRDMEIYEIK